MISLYMLYFTMIMSNRPVNSWSGRLNWTATYPPATPTPTQFYPMTEEYDGSYLYEKMEVLKKGVALSTGGRRCQGSWPVAIARHVFT